MSEHGECVYIASMLVSCKRAVLIDTSHADSCAVFIEEAAAERSGGSATPVGVAAILFVN